MACNCNTTPCGCSAGSSGSCELGPSIPVCDDTTPVCAPQTTLCDLDRVNNIWVEGADAQGQGGICLLDTMEEYQVIQSLQRSQVSHDDLLRVTSNEWLRNLAVTIPVYPGVVEGDTLQKEINQNTIPFYSVFRGQPPFAQ